MNVMFDIETLDVKPRSVVLSLGAVKFDAAGRIWDRFYRVLDVHSQLEKGRTVSFSTLRWWLTEGDDARDEAFNPVRQSVGLALSAFFGWCSAEDSLNNIEYWAWGPQFDGIIVETLAEDFDCSVPWSYRQLRDARTICEAANVDRRDITSRVVGIPHTPIYDCERQVELVTVALGSFS